LLNTPDGARLAHESFEAAWFDHMLRQQAFHREPLLRQDVHGRKHGTHAAATDHALDEILVGQYIAGLGDSVAHFRLS
jgi:hypothetical protein